MEFNGELNKCVLVVVFIKRIVGELVSINGVVSFGVEFL